ncbi:MAG: UbiA family prenyltransferase [Bacteroidota bacterium]
MGVTNFQKRNSFYLKIIALLSTVRWKNILVTVFAQYLAFLFAFNTKDDLWNSLVETKVHLIIAATAFILAGGYIINNFYDLEKDIINRPHRTRFQNLISDGFKLKFYLVLNTIGLLIAFIASWRIFIFFLIYGFLLWFYSHKLSKIVFVREMTACFLSVLAFFSLALYFKMVAMSFVLYGASLFFALFARELYKDIIWLKGDVVNGYQSIASIKGIQFSKLLFQIILISSILIDLCFNFYMPKEELLYMMATMGVVKIGLIFLISINTQPIHRIMQLLIMLYILGIIWL